MLQFRTHFHGETHSYKCYTFSMHDAKHVTLSHQHGGVLQGVGVSHRVDKSQLFGFRTVESLAWSDVTTLEYTTGNI